MAPQRLPVALPSTVEQALRAELEGRSDSRAELRQVPAWARLQRIMVSWMTDSVLGLLVARLGVATMKAVPFVSLLVVLRRMWRLNRIMMRSRRSKTWILMRSAFEMWTLVELIFYIYFRCKKWSLEKRRAYEPRVLWKAPNERQRLLTNFLTTIERIHAGQGSLPFREKAKRREAKGAGIFQALRPPPRQEPSVSMEMRNEAKASKGGPGKADQRPLSTLELRDMVENFLRLSDDHEPGFWYEPKACSKGMAKPMRPAPSVENLLRSWEVSEEVSPRTPADVDLQCLKHLELCSWTLGLQKVRFSTLTPKGTRDICRDVQQIRRGNIEQWLLSYFFDGAESTQELSDREAQELQELVDAVARWAGLPLDGEWAGNNEGLKCFRMRNDPFPAVHRPLLSYVNTAFVAPTIGHQVHGFETATASTGYWFRPPNPAEHWQHGLRPRLVPSGKALVFCHGVGVGPTMPPDLWLEPPQAFHVEIGGLDGCLTFLQRLTRTVGKEAPVFLVDTAGISMRFSDDVPGAREVAANIENMLQVWGLSWAHFVGHSFGAFVVAWVLRYARHVVERTTLIDPVCFLVLKILVQGHELQQVRHDTGMDPMEIAIKYFVMTELFVCNFVCRCFFWEESNLDMQDLEGTKALIVLESEDLIVPTYSVRSLVFAEQSRRAKAGKAPSDETGLELLWVEDQPHAGFLLDMVANEDVCARLAAFHGS
ncbi:unnamed protein product [Effrenium voratum]|nr:unnamed protein product [Effrenium voratum]